MQLNTFLTGLLLILFGQVGSTQTDFDFFDANTVQEIRLKTTSPKWRYTLDSLRVNGDEYLDMTISVNGKRYENVGVRYQDYRAFKPNDKRNPLDIKLDHKNKEQAHDGHAMIQLSSALRDPSLVRQVLTSEIFGNYMPTPRANYANLYVNDEYCGVYVNLEPVDAYFLTTHYGSSDGAYIKSNPSTDAAAVSKGCTPKGFAALNKEPKASCYEDNYVLKAGTWGDLEKLTQQLKEQPDQIEQILDVDETLWMLALNNVLVNLYSYTGYGSRNYMLYKSADGQFHPVIGDTNLSFGSYKNTGAGSDMAMKQLQRLDPFLHANEPLKPLISQLLKNDLYKKKYVSNIRTIMRDHFWNGTFEKRVKKLQSLLRFWLESDEHKYYTLEEFDKSTTTTIGKRSRVPGISTFMEGRAGFLRKHSIMTVLPPRVTEITVVGREPLSGTKITNFEIQATVDRYPKMVRLYYRFDDQSAFQTAEMADNGKSSDLEANDGVFGAKITPPSGKNEIEYYVFVENARAVSYSPSRYMYEQYTSSLEELNE